MNNPFKVPEDMCFDSENGMTRYLELSLLTKQRLEVTTGNWLQFDKKNQVRGFLNIFKGTYSVISSDPSCKKDNDRFTTVLLKPLCVRRVQRYVCANLSKPACIQLQIQGCAAFSLNSTPAHTRILAANITYTVPERNIYLGTVCVTCVVIK